MVAFGGGEPWAFPRFEELVCRLHGETPLAVSFTTNGLALTPRRLAAVRGRYGQCRVSLYDDNDWRRTVARLADAGARFGVNYLVTPERLASLETVVLELDVCWGERMEGVPRLFDRADRGAGRLAREHGFEVRVRIFETWDETRDALDFLRPCQPPRPTREA
jgi:MoaA/NifB/PqqE/SkfB family radical SAM enzyme